MTPPCGGRISEVNSFGIIVYGSSSWVGPVTKATMNTVSTVWLSSRSDHIIAPRVFTSWREA